MIVDGVNFMSNLFKGVISSLFAGITAYIFPVNNFLIVIAILFSLNFLFGWIAGIKSKESFSLKKAFGALQDLLIFFGLIITTFIIGNYMNVEENQILEFTSWLTWLVIYFYVANITKNVKQISPGNKAIDMLYWLINIEFVKNVRFLKDYLKTNRNEVEQ